MRWRAAAASSLLLVATSTWADAELPSEPETLTPGVLRIGTYFAPTRPWNTLQEANALGSRSI